MADADELQGNVVAGVAHDLNNQLMLVLNHLEASDISRAKAAAVRCSALTSGLLSWCRGEMPAILDMDAEAFLSAFGGSLVLPGGVTLFMDLPESLPAIRAEPEALSRVLTNLVDNASYAMGGSGVLRIRASAGCIQVEDSGAGISPIDRERIFQPFFTTKGSHGTGLGLAVVRDLMRQQGGSVRLLDNPGKGACFELRFRMARQRS